jgi:hypothetical protein
MASLVSYGLCQSACNAAVVTCYTAAGFTFGTVVAAAAAPAAVVGCNSILASCMAMCATKFLVEGSTETAASSGIMGPVIAAGGIAMGAGIFFTSMFGGGATAAGTMDGTSDRETDGATSSTAAATP